MSVNVVLKLVAVHHINYGSQHVTQLIFLVSIGSQLTVLTGSLKGRRLSDIFLRQPYCNADFISMCSTKIQLVFLMTDIVQCESRAQRVAI